MSETKDKLLKHFSNGGRPPKYTDSTALESKIKQYFEEFDRWTLEGLVVFLGFSTRQSLYDLEKQSDEFSYILKKVRMVLTSRLAEGLDDRGNATAGTIFHLKQFGWKDTIEQTNIEAEKITIPTFKDHK
jgi:hypothetical protein